MIDTVISIVIIAAIALFAGAWFLFKRGNAKQARLMVILGFVMAANVAIWLIPMEDGSTPADAAILTDE